MKKNYIRLTMKEIEAMRRMFRDGISLYKIGKIFRRDHTSVGYWVRLYKQDKIKKRRGFSKVIQTDASKDIKANKSKLRFIADEDFKKFYEKRAEGTKMKFSDLKEKIQEAREEENMNKLLDRDEIREVDCIICKKEKADPHWAKTRYCSLKCWDLSYEK